MSMATAAERSMPSPSSTRSPRTGSAAAPVNLPQSASIRRSTMRDRDRGSPRSYPSSMVIRRRRSSGDQQHSLRLHKKESSTIPLSTSERFSGKPGSSLLDSAAKAQSRRARKLNDAMVYLDGPQIYTCSQCRTHLTSHDEIISKSFHGRHGRAYLFYHCVNVILGPAEDRVLITGLHSVCDIFCKRCENMLGWTYAKAYESSQKYKEGKFIIEKINLHLEESDYYDIAPLAGERMDRFRARSICWGIDYQSSQGSSETVFEYHPSTSQSIPSSIPERNMVGT